MIKDVTCLGLCSTSCVVVVASMALLLPALSCNVMESPVTSWTPSSVMVTLSSTTLIVVLAKMASDSGENTCQHQVKSPFLGCFRFDLIFNSLPQTETVQFRKRVTLWKGSKLELAHKTNPKSIPVYYLDGSGPKVFPWQHSSCL